MKQLLAILVLMFVVTSCGRTEADNTSALDEQARTEINQRDLNAIQPAPKISWSLERDNLIKRFKLQNDRTISFYMYVFVEGVSDPIGYYQVNKVSSVNSQLTNTEQLVNDPHGDYSAGSAILPSPAEDGSYGTNGDAVFGFTPEDIYIEHNMHYIVSTVPLSFTKPVNRLTVINVKTAAELKVMMDKIR
jgi:hypothetical protein